MSLRQLALPLPTRTAMGRADFFVAPANSLALATVEDWRNWPGGRLVLVGPEGSGKSHLAQMWAAETGAAVQPAVALKSQMVASLAAGSVVIEDANRISPEAEAALFHLHNLTLAHEGRLLLTARAAPAQWPLTLPDLASRMQAAPVARLDPPDDALLSAVLLKHFADRQITVSPTLISYVVERMDRSLAAAAHLVDVLDRRALAEGRPVTRKLAAVVLDSAADGGR